MNKHGGDDDAQTWTRMLAYEETFQCVQCGYCLPACPTYETMGKETHSPRGRINLVKWAAEGKLTDWRLLADSIDNCLGCRACETACPTGVRYGAIFESAKHALQPKRPQSLVGKIVQRGLFAHVFPRKRVLRTLANATWLYQKSGIGPKLRGSRVWRQTLGSLGAFEPHLPALPSPRERARRPKRRTPQGEAHGKAAFFAGCLMDALFERTNDNSMRLLQATGCEVAPLAGGTCCGALHAHVGDLSLARELAKRNIAAFERMNASASGEIDYIVNNAGGCGAMLVEYGHLLREDPEWAERASAFSSKVRDISQVLALGDPLPFRERKPERGTEIVTYQRSCHMTNVQKVTSEPVRLLQSIPGVELREMRDKDKCCGSAGIYNLVHYREAMDILDVKMAHVKNTAAVTVVTTNPGCLLQMQMGISREGMDGRMRAVHLADYLAEACGWPDASE
ncbi:MAG: (Fe-S)-binding protein [Paenibacillaceae bacterium]|nr:(Fe-S)-binding protein [Paenibacillaceae bacterium]